MDEPTQPSESRRVVAETLPAEAASVRTAREAAADVASEAGASEEAVDDVRLATSEAVSNAVIHGYEPEDGGVVRFLAAAGSQDVIVAVEDDGRGLEARTSRPGLGTGLKIIKKLSTDMVVAARQLGGTSVQMRFGRILSSVERRRGR